MIIVNGVVLFLAISLMITIGVTRMEIAGLKEKYQFIAVHEKKILKVLLWAYIAIVVGGFSLGILAYQNQWL